MKSFVQAHGTRRPRSLRSSGRTTTSPTPKAAMGYSHKKECKTIAVINRIPRAACPDAPVPCWRKETRC
jgi:hypothetical protein